MNNTIYSAFGNSIRVKLIQCLADKPKNVTELISTCGLSQSAVSQHLQKLREAGLVNVKQSGREVWYSLRSKKTAEISKLIVSLEKETK
jgi:DNA-binding transcriptional ArsR family regulator